MANEVKDKKIPLIQSTHKNRKLKQMTIAFTTALLLGLLFGFFVLEMVKKETEVQSTLIQASAVTVDDPLEQQKLPRIDLQIIQAGVFETEDNAKVWEQKFRNLHLPVISWQRLEQYYLFVGIASSATSAENQMANAKELGVDVFTKEWHVKEKSLNLQAADYAWLTSFLTLWNESLELVEQGEGLNISDWLGLVGDSADLSDKIHALSGTVEQYMTANVVTEQSVNREILLHLLYRYEEIFVK